LAAGNPTGLGRLARTYLLALATAAPPAWELHAYFRTQADVRALADECTQAELQQLDRITPYFAPGGPLQRTVAEECDIPRRFAGQPLDAWLGLDFTLPRQAVARREYVVLPDLLPFTRPASVSWRARLLYRAGIRRALARGAGFICISRQTQQRLATLARHNAARSWVVPPPLSPALAHFASQDAVDLDKLQVMGSLNQAAGLRAFLLSVGVAGPRKNTALLVDIHRELVLQGDYRGSLVLVGGDGRYHSAPTRQFALQAVGSLFDQGTRAAAVYDVGRINDHELSLLYRSADLCVSLSQEEGFGYPVLEALAHGTPAFVTAGSSMLEIAPAGIVGSELERETCRRNLVSALAALPELRREAQRFDAGRYSLDAIGSELCAVLADQRGSTHGTVA
jgi:glycosyltransferase involved in cell wall biosynthesis